MDQDNTVMDETVPMVGPTTTSLALESTNEQRETQPKDPVKKKKCHGQRKKQRYRRQLYDQGLSSATVNRLVEERFSPVVPIQESDTLNFDVCIPLDRVGDLTIEFYLSILGKECLDVIAEVQ